MPDAAAARRPSPLKNIVGGSAGNLVEWFDWYVYSAFALYFAPSFFPKGDQTAQLLQTAAIFAVGFVMRPIGALGKNAMAIVIAQPLRFDPRRANLPAAPVVVALGRREKDAFVRLDVSTGMLREMTRLAMGF